MAAAPPANTGAQETLLLAASLLALSLVLAGRQWFERRSRRPEPWEAGYYAGRDRRRWLVVGILALIGGGMIATTRIDVTQGVSAARAWGWSWMVILLLALSLLVLAGLDWLANRGHAREQVQAMLDEQRLLLARTFRAEDPDQAEQGS